MLLGVGAPTDETCQSDGDVYIDTATVTFYECAAGAWTPSGPTAQVASADAHDRFERL